LNKIKKSGFKTEVRKENEILFQDVILEKYSNKKEIEKFRKSV